MNKEGVNRYNELLILYLNDFVDNITRNSDIKDRAIVDACEKLEELLIEYNITIDKKLIKQVIDNSFPMYSNLLKTSFDNAGIHRIDDNLSMSEIAKDMNEVTTNLSKAVNEANKIPEYIELIQKIKGTIIYLISQTNSNYVGHEYEVDQILNDVVGTFYSIYTEDLINSFLRDKLPELYKICDEINYSNEQDSNNDNVYLNEDRDKFINETMDLEIHEGFKNGKVTLSITDSMGQRTELIGAEAIEKLKNFNQLYESSRPGKKADTSNWPDESYLKIPTNNGLEVDLSAPINENTIEIKPAPLQVMDPTPIEKQPILPAPTNGEENNLDDFNNLTSPSGMTMQDEPPKNENEEMIKNFLNQYKNDTLSTPETSYNEQSTNDMSDLTVPMNVVEPPSILDQPINEEVLNTIENSSFEPESFIENYTEKTNEFIPQEDNNPVNANSFIPTYEEPPRTSYGDEFIGNYSNPNYDRDQFIKLTTGIEIQEDVDHRGKLFLRVTEPTGREVIYTGKEAVRMIKNYNQTYLDANPDKKVDTSLIDNFRE